MTGYLKQFFAVFAALMGLVAAINVIVDPNSAFRWDAVKGFNDQKTLKGDGGRVIKSLLLARHPFDVVFFGTSQGEVGLDPGSTVLGGAPAFNASLSYTNMHEMAHVMEFVAQHQRPKLVVIALDFMAFSGSEVTGGDFTTSGFAGASLWPAYVRRVFSVNSLKESVGVMRKSRRGQLQFFAKDGRVNPAVRGAFDHQGEFRSVIATYLASEPKANPSPQMRQNTFRSFAYSPQRVQLLREVVRRFELGGAQVLLFVTPVHTLYLEALTQSGLLPVYEQWKRDLTTSVAAINTSARRPVHLWDFSGNSSITMEPVAPLGASMRWYWDAAHFKAETGDLVLARMLGRDVVPEIAGFGRELTPASIDVVSTEIRQARTRFNGVPLVGELARAPKP